MSPPLPDLESAFELPRGEPSAVALIGVCGAGMKALAELFLDFGWTVIGSDRQSSTRSVDELCARGMVFRQGHHADLMPRGVLLVIHSAAVPPDSPELQVARENQLTILSYSSVLGRLMRARTGISVAGTHGKSTTTAMVTSILRHSGLDPSSICGAELVTSHRSGQGGSGAFLVVESCEYRCHFLELAPRHAIITGIEPDHFDCFTDATQLEAAFTDFIALLPSDGELIVNADCATTRRVLSTEFDRYGSQPDSGTLQTVLNYGEFDADVCRDRLTTFGFDESADVRAEDIVTAGHTTTFTGIIRGQCAAEFRLRVPGQHNVANALAAIALCDRLGLPLQAIIDGLEQFAGLKRRFEHLGRWKNIDLIDDYAHHPSAVRATLTTVAAQFPQRRILCAFQPHQVSRTLHLLADFALSFSGAHEVLITPVFAARENLPSEAILAAQQQLVAAIRNQGTLARAVSSLDHLVSTLDDDARAGDVVITMGAGNIDRIHNEFIGRLQRHS